jgi:hypothetical protein
VEIFQEKIPEIISQYPEKRYQKSNEEKPDPDVI